jgi:hypothetical protein
MNTIKSINLTMAQASGLIQIGYTKNDMLIFADRAGNLLQAYRYGDITLVTTIVASVLAQYSSKTTAHLPVLHLSTTTDLTRA